MCHFFLLLTNFIKFWQLREYAVKLKELVDKECSEAEIKEEKIKMMTEVGILFFLQFSVR